jgi:hypothetical protein
MWNMEVVMVLSKVILQQSMDQLTKSCRISVKMVCPMYITAFWDVLLHMALCILVRRL